MIVSFNDEGTEDIYDGVSSAKARKALPRNLLRGALRKLAIMNHVKDLNELRVPPANRLEALKGDREGQHSIRINDRYRLCFEWTKEGPTNVEIVDYH